MLHLTFLRDCHSTKNPHHHTSREFLKFFASVLGIAAAVLYLLTPTLSHAESNVAGDEIIIFADDNFKPALRDLGGSNLSNENSSAINSVP